MIFTLAQLPLQIKDRLWRLHLQGPLPDSFYTGQNELKPQPWPFVLRSALPGSEGSPPKHIIGPPTAATQSTQYTAKTILGQPKRTYFSYLTN